MTDQLPSKGTTKDLTRRQAQVLDYVERCIENGMPPTRAEIAQRFGFKSVNAAQDYLQALANKGRIELLDGKSRGIMLVKQ